MSLLIILNGFGPLATPPPTVIPSAWSPALGAMAGLGTSTACIDPAGTLVAMAGLGGTTDLDDEPVTGLAGLSGKTTLQ